MKKGLSIKDLMPDLMIGLTLKYGEEIIKQWREEGHSWTRNAYNWMYACMTDCPGNGGSNFGAGYMTSKRTSATIDSSTTSTANRNTSSQTGMSGFVNGGTTSQTLAGIVVGTGDTAFSVNDSALAALIGHGADAGLMQYMAMGRPVVAYNGTSKVWTTTLERQFLNSSGADITVKEVGFYHSSQLFSGTVAATKLFARDILLTAATVANGISLTVEYEISRDFSDID